jgi:hypothetical protein
MRLWRHAWAGSGSELPQTDSTPGRPAHTARCCCALAHAPTERASGPLGPASLPRARQVQQGCVAQLRLRQPGEPAPGFLWSTPLGGTSTIWPAVPPCHLQGARRSGAPGLDRPRPLTHTPCPSDWLSCNCDCRPPGKDPSRRRHDLTHRGTMQARWPCELQDVRRSPHRASSVGLRSGWPGSC